MRRPLVLEVFEQHPTIGPLAYRSDGAFMPYTLLATDKKFTDAELAAECYRQMTRGIAESGMCGDGFDIAPRDAATFGPIRVETSRLRDMKRFAMLPHAAESDYE